MSSNNAKAVVIYANCQANALGSLLQISRDFNRQYIFHRIKPVHRLSREELSSFISNDLNNTSILIHQPISRGFRDGSFCSELLKQKAPQSTKIISFPSLQFYAYHATAFALKGMTSELRQRHHEVFQTPGADTFHFLQVVRAYLDGADTARAEDRFHGGDPGDSDLVTNFAAKSIGIMELSEAANGTMVTSAGFIKANYQGCLLFHTPRHPSAPLLLHVIEQISKICCFQITPDEKSRMLAKDPLRFPQYPLQGFVREALGLRFEAGSEFRSKKLTLSISQMIEAFYHFYAMCPRSYLMSEYERQAAALAA
jgi:hypothetical protein